MADSFSRTVAVSAGLPTAGGYGSSSGDPGFSSAIHNFRNTTPLAVDTATVDLNELRETFTTAGDLVGRQLLKFTPGLIVEGHLNSIATFRLDNIFRMCGMIKTTSGSSLTYKFKSTYAANGGATGYNDGIINVQYPTSDGNMLTWRMLGVQGTFVMAGSAGQPITLEPTLQGFYADPVGPATLIAPSLPTLTVEIMENEGMTIGGTQYKFKSFSMDAAMDVQEDTDANDPKGLNGLVIANRKSTLQVVIGADSAAYSTFFTALKAGTQQTITFTHGSVAGRFMKLTATGKLTNVGMTEETGLRTFTLDYRLTNATADSELQLDFY